MAIEVHGANGYSNDYPVERYLRNCKAAIIYEGTRDIHTLMQADWALGLKKEKAARKTLPPWKSAESRLRVKLAFGGALTISDERETLTGLPCASNNGGSYQGTTFCGVTGTSGGAARQRGDPHVSDRQDAR